jgi:hypothetical protein
MGFCKKTDLDGSWSAGESKLCTFNAKLDQEGPAFFAAVLSSLFGTLLGE